MKTIIMILILGTVLSLHAQIENVNPDPNGEQWLIFVGEDSTWFDPDLYLDYPSLILDNVSKNKTLPYKVDNSKKKYFRKVFYQGEAVCVAASKIGYIYTYEINRLRNTSSDDSTNLYSHYYPVNYWNNFWEYDSTKTFYPKYNDPIIATIKENGIPNILDFGGIMVDYSRHWVNGYEKYYRAMHNQALSAWEIKIFNEDSLNVLKHWLSDHGSGDSTGGLVKFGMNFYGTETSILPPQSQETGDQVVINFGNSGAHAMTFVGYNDSVMFDFNGDSLFTNNLDINGDDTVDMKDWEIGALKCVNSWGYNIWDSGFIWVPYRLFAFDTGGITSKEVVGMYVNENHDPLITYKVGMSHPRRNKIQIVLGVSNNPLAISPDKKDTTIVNFIGDDLPMCGEGLSDTIEMGFDASNLISNVTNPCKFFLDVYKSYIAYPGYIHHYSLYDYRCSQAIEIPLDTADVLLISNDYTRLVIYYNPIPLTIDYDTLVEIDAAVRCTTNVTHNSTLTFDDGITVDFYKGTLIVEEGSKLIIGDNVTIKSKTGSNKILVFGELEIGDNLIVTSSDSSDFKFDINNDLLDLEISGADFNKTTISGHSKTLSIEDTDFYEGCISYSKADIEINNSDFVYSYLKASNGASKSSYCYLTGNSFTFYNGNPVYIYSYPQYKVDSCTIFENSLDGVCIYYSGTKPAGNHSISYNLIEDNGQYAAGVKLYQSEANVHYNSSIARNKFGILIMNNSNVSLKGKKGASSVTSTQYIHDNFSNQIYATQGSFPYYFSWNAIVDENNSVPLVYYSTTVSEELDVKNNYWGENFNYEQDFFPYTDYIYIPVWNLGGGDDEGEAAAMYSAAQNSISNENYSGAKTQMLQIVTTYPSSKYAQASLRQLFTLEEFATDDYTELKSYYLTNQVIQNNSDLLKLADYLANYCEIKLENYPTAIAWFENIIQNPETIEDSVFAIIDLGYTYFLMENGGLKSAYTGTMPEHKPTSVKQYEDKRDYLLSLIFNNSEIHNKFENDLQNLKSGELLQNIPNPYKNNTRIWYKLENESLVEIKIHNNTGQLVRKINEGTKTKGNHSIDFNATGLKNGIYFYSISINGQTTDSKKMTIMK